MSKWSQALAYQREQVTRFCVLGSSARAERLGLIVARVQSEKDGVSMAQFVRALCLLAGRDAVSIKNAHAVATIRAPICASRSAAISPILEVPPVMTTVLPFIGILPIGSGANRRHLGRQ
jgi:hypothetical protein